jgi:hypothetical protein
VKIKKVIAVLGFALSLAATGPAFASGCYTNTEFEAEQGLRIHSELMVIGLTCARMPGGQDLYREYNSFTLKNQALISGYEETLIRYYRSQGAPNPEQKLHTLRTNLANKISQHAIQMSTKSFCQYFGPRIPKALAMDQNTVRRWAQHVWADTPTTQPICARY